MRDYQTPQLCSIHEQQKNFYSTSNRSLSKPHSCTQSQPLNFYPPPLHPTNQAFLQESKTKKGKG